MSRDEARKRMEELPAFTDYCMEGRTYLYLKEKAQYPFGFDLTYSMGLSDLLKILAPHTASFVKSRYKNTYLNCKLVLLTVVLDMDISTPKTDAGIRVIPMIQEVQRAKKEHRKAELLPKVSAACYAPHSLYQNGGVPYGYESVAIHHGTCPYRCNYGGL